MANRISKSAVNQINKNVQVGFRVSPAEREQWRTTAQSRHMCLSEWFRHLARVECGSRPKRANG